MLRTPGKMYLEEPFEREADLEEAILECASALFGQNRIYFDPKREIGGHGKTKNIPDGYLLDLASAKERSCTWWKMNSPSMIPSITSQFKSWSSLYPLRAILTRSKGLSKML